MLLCLFLLFIKVMRMIILDQVSKQYAPNQLALDKVSLQIEGGVFGLLGPNGAGKTTLIRILCTLLAPTSGSISINNFDVLVHMKEIREILGYVPQEYRLYPQLKAREFLDYMGILSGINNPTRRQRIEETLHEVGLSEHAHRPLGEFSGGMKQRVAIAQALLHKPKILIVDEPTAGLDPGERVRFRNLLVKLSRDSQILLSTHIVPDITAACSHLALLDRGRIIFHGAPSQMIAQVGQRVWTITVPFEELASMQRNYTIVSTRSDEISGAVQVRFITPDVDAPDAAEAVAPSLEDAYLSLTARKE